MQLPTKHSFTRTLYHCPPLPRSGSFASPPNSSALGTLTLPDRLLPCFWLLILDASFVPLHVHEHLRPSRSLSLRDRSPLDCPCFDHCLMNCWLSSFLFPRSPMDSARGRFQRGFSLVFQVMLVQLFFHTNACFCPVSLHVHFPLSLSFFSFRAVAVNSNSCGPAQWRYRASV